MRRLAGVLLALALVAAPFATLARPAEGPAASRGEWLLVQPEAPLGSPARGVTETRWVRAVPPFGTHDRIQLHRYRRQGARHGAPRAALLYLPGTFMNGHAAVRDPAHNLWLHLAREGIEVFALDYRTHFVPPASADAGAHRFMRDWTLARFVADAHVAAALARRESGRERIFVAGFSRGATLAYGLTCSEPPEGLAGLVVLDGPFKAAVPRDFDLAAARTALFAKGVDSNDVAGGLGWATRQALMEAAARDPKAPATRPGFENVGEQVARILYDAWAPGALADAVNGVSRVQVLARLLAGYDRYWPAIQNLEGRSIASLADDPHTPLDDAWGELRLPILYFGARNLGADWIRDGVHSAEQSGSDDVEVRLLDSYGHLDVLVGERAREDVYVPLTRWIAGRSPRAAE